MPHRVVRSARRTVAIEVGEDGSVLVRAPERATDAQIEAILRRRAGWIATRAREAPSPEASWRNRSLVAGSSVRFLGRAYRLRVVPSADDPLAFDGARFLVCAEALPDVSGHLSQWFQAQARARIPALVEETAYRLGFRYRAVRVADLRARWASFSPTAILTFNWRLIHAPLFVLRYVIAHELAHTVEANHGVRFWNLVRSICSRVDESRSWLTDHESELEQLL
jgi:predicted metal-dependent hydrolase